MGILLSLASLAPIKGLDFSKTMPMLGIGTLLILFSILTVSYSGNYKNHSTFAKSAYASAPSIDNSYSGMAQLFLEEGNDAAAESVLCAGIARKPSMYIVHRMLGDIYAHRGEYSLADREYEISLQIEPLYLYTYISYAKMCLDIGDIDAAISLWKTSVHINPDFLLGYYYLSNCYIHTKNNPDSAMIYVREIQQRGATVMPELLQAIKSHPLYLNK